jgi:hypothetical protein
MTHKNYAFIKNDKVVNVVVFDDPTEEILQIFKNEHEVDLIIEATLKTVVGGTFDGNNFWIIQPFPSWIKNENTIEWEAPTEMPIDGFDYQWNESKLKWVKIDLPTPE